MHPHDHYLRKRADQVCLGTDPGARRCAAMMFWSVRDVALSHGDGAMRELCARMAIGPSATWPAELRMEADRLSEESVRAALSFWSSVTDPAVWLTVVSGS